MNNLFQQILLNIENLKIVLKHMFCFLISLIPDTIIKLEILNNYTYIFLFEKIRLIFPIYLKKIFWKYKRNINLFRACNFYKL